MPLTYSEVRSAVMDYLRTHPEGQVPVRLQIFRRFEEQGHPVRDEDLTLAQQVFHELYLERIITGANPDSMGDGLMSWPFYRLTAFGKQNLNPQSTNHMTQTVPYVARLLGLRRYRIHVYPRLGATYLSFGLTERQQLIRNQHGTIV